MQTPASVRFSGLRDVYWHFKPRASKEFAYLALGRTIEDRFALTGSANAGVEMPLAGKLLEETPISLISSDGVQTIPFSKLRLLSLFSRPITYSVYNNNVLKPLSREVAKVLAPGRKLGKHTEAISKQLYPMIDFLIDNKLVREADIPVFVKSDRTDPDPVRFELTALGREMLGQLLPAK